MKLKYIIPIIIITALLGDAPHHTLNIFKLKTELNNTILTVIPVVSPDLNEKYDRQQNSDYQGGQHVQYTHFFDLQNIQP